MPGNFERMMQLAAEVFEVHNDPQQLDVDENIITQLQALHPSAVMEYANEEGPIIWVLMIPTTRQLMNAFVNGQLGETELLNQTPVGIQYQALYLCSALTLPEFRNQGLTKKIALEAISEIRKIHPIEHLFVWNFSQEGSWLANSLANSEHIPLIERPR
jgi:hypothetical protein